jgi:hypothetical protein
MSARDSAPSQQAINWRRDPKQPTRISQMASAAATEQFFFFLRFQEMSYIALDLDISRFYLVSRYI